MLSHAHADLSAVLGSGQRMPFQSVLGGLLPSSERGDFGVTSPHRENFRVCQSAGQMNEIYLHLSERQSDREESLAPTVCTLGGLSVGCVRPKPGAQNSVASTTTWTADAPSGGVAHCGQLSPGHSREEPGTQAVQQPPVQTHRLSGPMQV